mmetsp:Transcript_71719/g.191342  ORF Transcript_71719/g.191342 Transcript_71719/m.191342 type:complete len:473 (+) Transcript_71719:608-2026(+)
MFFNSQCLASPSPPLPPVTFTALLNFARQHRCLCHGRLCSHQPHHRQPLPGLHRARPWRRVLLLPAGRRRGAGRRLPLRRRAVSPRPGPPHEAHPLQRLHAAVVHPRGAGGRRHRAVDQRLRPRDPQGRRGPRPHRDALGGGRRPRRRPRRGGHGPVARLHYIISPPVRPAAAHRPLGQRLRLGRRAPGRRGCAGLPTGHDHQRLHNTDGRERQEQPAQLDGRPAPEPPPRRAAARVRLLAGQLVPSGRRGPAVGPLLRHRAQDWLRRGLVRGRGAAGVCGRAAPFGGLGRVPEQLGIQGASRLRGGPPSVQGSAGRRNLACREPDVARGGSGCPRHCIDAERRQGPGQNPHGCHGHRYGGRSCGGGVVHLPLVEQDIDDAPQHLVQGALRRDAGLRPRRRAHHGHPDLQRDRGDAGELRPDGRQPPGLLHLRPAHGGADGALRQGGGEAGSRGARCHGHVLLRGQSAQPSR